MMEARMAFEAFVALQPIRGVSPQLFLRKLETRDPSNPEYLDRAVDQEWQIFRAGFLAARAL